MSAFRFYLDAEGYVCGGRAVTDALSDETWRLTACPVRSLEETGVAICWPDGDRWTHDHIAGEFANSLETLPKSTSQEAA